MRLSNQFAAVLLLTMAALTMGMPCVTASGQSMPATHACCHGMKMQCETPASTTCCKAVPQNQTSAALDAKTPTLRAVALNAVTLPVEGAIPGSAAATYAQAEHSPPQSPPNILSSLRV